ncbi:MAG TPA: lysylphosphatidylglycerol synthase domain-containing protein [Pyrinomonadaceae bacterium]|nr:lysylphosphatidylglycerol synthase domain-containing protein [Pyrinomonadaceae bacterium]
MTKGKSASRRFAPAGAFFALAGLLLFAYFVWKAGPWEIWANISKIGAGFVWVILLSGLRFSVRSFAWTLCFDPPHRLPFIEAFKAYLVGDTAGNIVPLGLAVSEPTKVALVKERVPLVAALSAIAVENIFYMLSVALFIFCGAAALLLSFRLPKVLRWSSGGVIVGALVFALFAFFAARRQWKFLSGSLDWLAARGLGRRFAERRRAGVVALEEKIYGFYARRRGAVPVILALEAAFHMLGVAEAYLTIMLISGSPPTLLSAFLFESVNRVITMVFKFVPLRAGVDEAGTGQLASLLALGMTAGVTLAVVRKARMVFWMTAGVALLAGRGLSLRRVAEGAAESAGEWDAAAAEEGGPSEGAPAAPGPGLQG